LIKKAFKMQVYNDCFDEYKRRHDNLWPEMAEMLKEHGVYSYAIFLDEGTGQLFAYAEIADEKQWQAIADTPVCRRWWHFMHDIMETEADESPVSLSLRQVFNFS
jgi:L-rhamnose mutarotase